MMIVRKMIITHSTVSSGTSLYLATLNSPVEVGSTLERQVHVDHRFEGFKRRKCKALSGRSVQRVNGCFLQHQGVPARSERREW